MNSAPLANRGTSPIHTYQLLSVIRDVQDMFIREAPPTELFAHMLRSVLDISESRYGFVGELMHDENGAPFLRTYAITNIAWNDLTRQVYAGFKRDGYLDFTNPETLFGSTLISQEVVIANDPANDPRRGGTPAGHPPLESYMGLPFFLGSRMVGMFGLANRPGGFDQGLAEELSPLLKTCAQLIEAYRSERERREAQQALETNQRELTRFSAHLNALFTLSPDGYAAFDEDGVIRMVNPAFTAMTGLETETLIGKNRAELSEALNALCNCGDVDLSDASMGQLRLVRPRPSVLSYACRELYDEREEYRIIGLAVYLRDVTHETEVDRMKTEFLSTAAHELRTPMASIHGFTELLIKRQFDDETRLDLLETIHRQSSALINMLNELLDLARIEARAGKDMNIELHALHPLLVSLGHALEPTLSGQHELIINFPDSDISAYVDAEKFRQATLNVLSNAVKYSPEGGQIRVECDRSMDDNKALLGIVITDQGIGMSDQELERIYDRFYRADRAGTIPGTGLGMSLVKEIMDLHDGRVDLESHPGGGTRVTLWFPTTSPSETSALKP